MGACCKRISSDQSTKTPIFTLGCYRWSTRSRTILYILGGNMFSDETTDHCEMIAKLSTYRVVGQTSGIHANNLPFWLTMILHSEIRDLDRDLMHENIVYIRREVGSKLHVGKTRLIKTSHLNAYIILIMFEIMQISQHLENWTYF